MGTNYKETIEPNDKETIEPNDKEKIETNYKETKCIRDRENTKKNKNKMKFIKIISKFRNKISQQLKKVYLQKTMKMNKTGKPKTLIT